MTEIRASFMPGLTPEHGQKTTFAMEGLSVAQMVAELVGGDIPAQGALRVVLTSRMGSSVVSYENWDRVYPKAGTTLVVRVVPEKDAARAIVGVVIAIAAPYVAGALFPKLTGMALNLVTAGIAIGGQLLVSTLFPPKKPRALNSNSLGAAKTVYQVDGWSNEARPGSPVPFVAGRMRYAPPFAATSYSEIVGNDQYVRALFVFGYGPLKISDLRIGETPISEYQDVQIETREGHADDTPITLYPSQVIEEGQGIELARPFPRDGAGNVISGSAPTATPVTRFTAADSAQASIILVFQQGLYQVDDEGNPQQREVNVRIRQRLHGAGDWEEVETLTIRAKIRERFFRQFTWTLPERGRWQIEVERMNADTDDNRISDRVTFAALQSFRPEYPINLPKPLALVAVRVRATHQLNGPLDSLNGIVEAHGPTGVERAWTQEEPRTPAIAFLNALTGPLNPFPTSQAHVDWDTIEDWHLWCIEKGLKYDRVHDTQVTFDQLLVEICSAGRASPRHDGRRWSIVIERPQPFVIDTLNNRNATDFRINHSYIRRPDAFRVTFMDETANYRPAERIIPWPGHTGSIDLTEALELPGKTDPDEIWRETRRHQHAIDHRTTQFSCFQEGQLRQATRGDTVSASFRVLDRTVSSARVRTLADRVIVLDNPVEIGAGFVARFRVFDSDDDEIGTVINREIGNAPGITAALHLTGDGPLPEVGYDVDIGPSSQKTRLLRLHGIEAAQAGANRLLLFPEAPEIDALTDAEVPPPWDGRVGSELGGQTGAPAAPRFAEIATGQASTGADDLVSILLEPGPDNAQIVTGFELDHRLADEETAATLSFSAASAGVVLDQYQAGQEIALVARALSNGRPGPDTEVVLITVGVGTAQATTGETS